MLHLRHDLKLPLKFPDTLCGCQTHRQLPILAFLGSVSKWGYFPPTALPSFFSIMSLSDFRSGRHLSCLLEMLPDHGSFPQV